jgi:hypothetical protein
MNSALWGILKKDDKNWNSKSDSQHFEVPPQIRDMGGV